MLPASTQAATTDYLHAIHRHTTLASTITPTGDLNPYALVVAPSSVGKIQKNEVLITNFNNKSNLQATGTTIVGYKRMDMSQFQFTLIETSSRLGAPVASLVLAHGDGQHGLVVREGIVFFL